MPNRIRGVNKGRYRNFVRKSDEFHRSAEDAFQRGDWDAAVANAIHAGISMADALTVSYLSQRSASQDHASVVDLLSSIGMERQELDRNRKHISALLEVKNVAEYEERLLNESDAKTALEHCRRFRAWARGKLAP